MTDLVSAATGYLAAGFSIIALVGKAPNNKFHPQGLKNALKGVPDDDDCQLIEDIFGAPSTTGVGIVIEYPYLVIDVDGEEGAKAFADMIGGVDVEDAPVARTGRGLHIWFADYMERPSTRLAEKLDLKGVGGYVAVPPSRHPDGHLYEWLNPLVDANGLNVPMDIPDALREHLRRRDANLDRFAFHQQRDRALAITFNADGSWQVVPDSMTGLVSFVHDLEEGNRNAGLFWSACIARDEGVPVAEALIHLVAAATAAGLPAHEARIAIRSAYRGSR